MTTAQDTWKPPTSTRRWQRVKNTGATTIPAFGLVKVTGAEEQNGRTVLTVTLPAAATDAMTKMIGVAYAPIRAGSFGWVTFQWPAYVLYNTNHTPAFGELWAPNGGAATIGRGGDGFMVLSSSPLSSPDRLLVYHAPHFHRPLFIRCELDAALDTTDATVPSFTVLEGFTGISTGITDPASINNLAASSDYVFSGETNDVFLAYYDWNDQTYTIFQMEC